MKKSVKTILNGLGVAIMVVDSSNEIAYLNGAATTLFPKAFPGKKLSKIVRSEKGLKATKRILNGQDADQINITLQDVVPTSYRVTIAPMETDAGNRNAILSFEDVSHIKDAQKMREDFVANVSHELRSPLTALYGFIETLRGPARDDSVATDRFLALMQDESERMMRLIDDLLSLSQLQVSERVIPVDSVDLREIISRVCETLGAVSAKEKIRIVTDFPKKMPMVRGDADELRQVFQNLIENSLKYSAPNTEIRIYTKKKETDDRHLCICVKDQGDGIDPKHIPRLTERFYRVDKGRSRAKGGTGLGLAIVKHILIRHRGWLKIKSEVDKGSAFSVYLPIAPA